MIRCNDCSHICQSCDLTASHQVTSVTLDPPTYHCPECGCEDFDEVERVIEYVYRCKRECEGLCEFRYQIDGFATIEPPTVCSFGDDAEWELVSETEKWRVV